MREINPLPLPHICHAPIECIAQCILCQIILWIKPFFLEFSPKSLCDIQMWRVWWQEKEEQSSFLPIRYSFSNIFSFMYPRIIQDNKGCTIYIQRQLLEETQNECGVDFFFGHLPITLALPVNQAKAVEFIRFFGEKANIFIRKLPTIRDITFAANMGFIPIIKVYFISQTHRFKLLEFLYLKIVMLFQRLPFRSSSYTLISSAKALKKILNVLSLTCLPLWDSHSALAVRMRCLLALIADRIADLSVSIERTALRPRPGLVTKPVRPSDWYRLTQLFTLTAHKPVIEPTSFDLRPSALSKMLWQRCRKQWLVLSRKLRSNSWRCSAVKAGVLTLPIGRQRYK